MIRSYEISEAKDGGFFVRSTGVEIGTHNPISFAGTLSACLHYIEGKYADQVKDKE